MTFIVQIEQLVRFVSIKRKRSKRIATIIIFIFLKGNAKVKIFPSLMTNPILIRKERNLCLTSFNFVFEWACQDF